MIPKTIHYVWVGDQQKPNLVKSCIHSWHKYLGDYVFVEWNENNFDMNTNSFVKEAYDQKKWAFVSDYIRLYSIYKYGGIYMDTDVLVLKSLDKLLNNEMFIGFENKDLPFTATFGAIDNHPFVKKILDLYNKMDFIYNPNNEYLYTNTKIISDILINDFKCIPNNQPQALVNDITVYPDSILCNPSPESYTIHLFNGSWLEHKNRLVRSLASDTRLLYKYPICRSLKIHEKMETLIKIKHFLTDSKKSEKKSLTKRI